MNVSKPFIERPVATSLLMAALLLAGIAAYRLLPVAPLPQVDFPTIQVSASLPGASPETMASNVAMPLERFFSLIPALNQMTSTSTLGSTSITLQFDLARSIDSAAIDVAAAINAAGGQLPTNLPSPPTYRKVNPADRPILIMGMSSETLPLTQVSDLADSIVAQQISQLPGVGQVSIFGARKPAVRVQVDPAKIGTLGLGLEDVRAQLITHTVNAPKGAFDGPAQSVTVYDNDQLFNARAWNEVIVGYRNGAPIRVRDIGRAVDGPENMKSAAWAFAGPLAGAEGSALANGETIMLAVFKQPNANVIDTVNGIMRALPRIEMSIPPAVKVAVVSDRTQTIRASVVDVEFTLLLTVVLVVLVIFVFLRNVAATLIPATTIPLALLGTAALMYAANYSLDNLSLMALTIAIGFVVDDAIVVLENIYRHLENGVRPLDAAITGAREVGFTVVSISVSLVSVFIPLLFMGGIIGRFFREFAVTITFTIALSVLVSLTLIPMLCSIFLKQHSSGERHGWLFELTERGFHGMQQHYERALRVVLRHQPLTLLVFLVTAAISVALYLYIPKGFFPQQDTGFIQGIAESSQDTSFAAMRERALAVADVVCKDPDVYSVALTLGNNTYNTSNFFITLRPKEAGRQVNADQIIGRLRPRIAALQDVNLYMQAAQDITVGGRLARTQYQYTLTDSDIAELGAWAPRIMERLRGLPQVTDVVSDQQTNAAALNLTIDRDRASTYGISPATIDATLYDAIGQRQITQYFTQLNAYHVVLEVTPELQSDPRLLDKLYVTSPAFGKQVPLSTFVKIDNTRTNYLSVSHQGQYPAVTISFNLSPGAALGDAVDAIQAAMADMGAPATIVGTFQGTAQAFQQSLASQPYLIAAALIAVYIVLGLLYESYVHPLTILSTLPSAGVGALLILMLFGYELTVIALIAIILLIGIVKKNGIMMVDFALTAERERGLDPETAILQACLLRFRPIMMTTMCALLAGVPLMLGTGTGSELRRPLGFAMVGGLALSQLLTLFTTPVIYLYLDRINRRLERMRGRIVTGANV